MNIKYEFTGKSINYGGHLLFQIKAIKSFNNSFKNIEEGELGGWLESSYNLSHDDGCWVFSDCYVLGLSEIKDNAYVSNGALIVDSKLSNNAFVDGKAYVGHSVIEDDAKVIGSVEIDNAVLDRHAVICRHNTASRVAFEEVNDVSQDTLSSNSDGDYVTLSDLGNLSSLKEKINSDGKKQNGESSFFS